MNINIRLYKLSKLLVICALVSSTKNKKKHLFGLGTVGQGTASAVWIYDIDVRCKSSGHGLYLDGSWCKMLNIKLLDVNCKSLFLNFVDLDFLVDDSYNFFCKFCSCL